MRKTHAFNFGTAALSAVLLLSVALAALLSGSPAKADTVGNDFSQLFDANGNLLPGVTQVGETSVAVSWMPTFPSWTGIQPQAVYNEYVAPDGTTFFIPSTTTLFFMSMNPVESGLTTADGQLGNGLGTQISLWGSMGQELSNLSLSGLLQDISNMSLVDANLFADAALAGNGGIWSLFGQKGSDVFNLMGLLSDLSGEDGNVYMLGLFYDSCNAAPGGCPAEVCLANPVLCGLPATPDPTTVTVTPPPVPICPLPSFTQAPIIHDISATAPNHPLAVGQDDEKRGVDISGSIKIPPVIYYWYEVGQDTECHALNNQHPVGNCTRNNGMPGYIIEGPACILHQATLPEEITQVIARAEMTQASVDYITGELRQQFPGAYVHQASFNLATYGQPVVGCGGGTCSADLTALNVPFADPATFNLTLMVGTKGTYYQGRMITQPRTISTKGSVRVYIVIPTLIDASSN